MPPFLQERNGLSGGIATVTSLVKGFVGNMRVATVSTMSRMAAFIGFAWSHTDTTVYAGGIEGRIGTVSVLLQGSSGSPHDGLPVCGQDKRAPVQVSIALRKKRRTTLTDTT